MIRHIWSRTKSRLIVIYRAARTSHGITHRVAPISCVHTNSFYSLLCIDELANEIISFCRKALKSQIDETKYKSTITFQSFSHVKHAWYWYCNSFSVSQAALSFRFFILCNLLCIVNALNAIKPFIDLSIFRHLFFNQKLKLRSSSMLQLRVRMDKNDPNAKHFKRALKK